MSLLNRQYYETQYRIFGNIAMRWIIDRSILMTKKHQGSKNKQLFQSGLVKEQDETSWITSDEGFLWNVLRYWSEYFLMGEEYSTSWAYSWRQYICGIPNVGYGDWDEWDALITVFIRSLYLDYWNAQFVDNDSKDVRHRFWSSLWEIYAKSKLIEVIPTLEKIQPVIYKMVQTEPFNLSVLNQIDSVLEQMCEVNGISYKGVRQPGWINFLKYPNDPMCEEPENPLDWDLPLVVFARVTKRNISPEMVVSFLMRNMKRISKQLSVMISNVHSEPSDLYEFWFPLQNHAIVLGTEVAMGSNSKMVSISESLAIKLTDSGGIGPRPSVSSGDAFVVVSCSGKTLYRACEDALRELGHIQTMLRVADAGFRWETSFYYYWTLRETNKPIPICDLFTAERRDNRQLYGPLTPDWLTKYRDWLSGIEEKSSDLAKALLVAMKWQGLSRIQDGAEGEFLCLWIALERLGNGSYHIKEVIPHVAGSIWNSSMWASLPPHERFRGIYQNRKLMKQIVGDLGALRNKEVAHRGQFSGKQDVRYATWLLKHLVNDLILWILSLVMNQDDIRTVDDLMRYIDHSLNLV